MRPNCTCSEAIASGDDSLAMRLIVGQTSFSDLAWQRASPKMRVEMARRSDVPEWLTVEIPPHPAVRLIRRE